jgi:hypothetical protein
VHSFKVPLAWPQKKMNSSSVVRDQEHVERFEEIRDFLDL